MCELCVYKMSHFVVINVIIIVITSQLCLAENSEYTTSIFNKYFFYFIFLMFLILCISCISKTFAIKYKTKLIYFLTIAIKINENTIMGIYYVGT